MGLTTNKKSTRPRKETKKQQEKEKHSKVDCLQEKVTYFDQEKFLDDLRSIGVRVSARKPV